MHVFDLLVCWFWLYILLVIYSHPLGSKRVTLMPPYCHIILVSSIFFFIFNFPLLYPSSCHPHLLPIAFFILLYIYLTLFIASLTVGLLPYYLINLLFCFTVLLLFYPLTHCHPDTLTLLLNYFLFYIPHLYPSVFSFYSIFILFLVLVYLPLPHIFYCLNFFFTCHCHSQILILLRHHHNFCSHFCYGKKNKKMGLILLNLC